MMPIHDWTRVSAGTWHDFHVAWIAELRNALNERVLPAGYYAQAEQIAGAMGPDVLALEAEDDTDDVASSGGGPTLAVQTSPPNTRLRAQGDVANYTGKRRTIVVRHTSGDRIVALIEIMSSGNKSSTHAFHVFVEKAVEAVQRGFHVLIVDLFPTSPRDPNGIHGAIWSACVADDYRQPADEPLTLVSYCSGRRTNGPTQAYVEPTAVGRALIDMPLFLDADHYVNVPLEGTYAGAFRGMPPKWKRVLEAN